MVRRHFPDNPQIQENRAAIPPRREPTLEGRFGSKVSLSATSILRQLSGVEQTESDESGPSPVDLPLSGVLAKQLSCPTCWEIWASFGNTPQKKRSYVPNDQPGHRDPSNPFHDIASNPEGAPNPIGVGKTSLSVQVDNLCGHDCCS